MNEKIKIKNKKSFAVASASREELLPPIISCAPSGIAIYINFCYLFTRYRPRRMFKLLKIASVVALTIADPNAAASSDELRAATGGVEGAAAHAGTAPLRGAFDHLPPHMRQDFDPVEVEKILGRTPEPHELERFRREQTMMRMDPRYRMMQDMKMRLETVRACYIFHLPLTPPAA